VRKIRIILASQSAARRGILVGFGINAEIYVTNADESLEGDRYWTPDEIVTELARRKADKAVLETGDPSALIIAADTIVAFGGQILGKPENPDDAVKTLASLSGKYHEVYSGICVAYKNKTVCGCDVTKVKFRDIEKSEIEAYAASGDPLTKAGSYGAEGIGAAFIENIEGDFFNIAGLPVFKFVNILKNDFDMTVFDLLFSLRKEKK
jgi:septum formation protein